MLKQIFIPISPSLFLKGTIRDKINYLFKSYLLLFLLLIGLGIFLKAFDLLLVNFFHIPSIIKSSKVNADLTMTYGKVFGLLIIALGAPFLEELIFRLPLNLNSSSIAITIAVISYRLMVDHVFKFNRSWCHNGLLGI